MYHVHMDIKTLIFHIVFICLSDSVYIWITLKNQYNSSTPESILESYSGHTCVESESCTITIQNSTPHNYKRFWLRFHQHEPKLIPIPTLTGVTVKIVISFTPCLNKSSESFPITITLVCKINMLKSVINKTMLLPYQVFCFCSKLCLILTVQKIARSLKCTHNCTSVHFESTRNVLEYISPKLNVHCTST